MKKQIPRYARDDSEERCSKDTNLKIRHYKDKDAGETPALQNGHDVPAAARNLAISCRYAKGKNAALKGGATKA